MLGNATAQARAPAPQAIRSEHRNKSQRRSNADHDGGNASDLFAADIERRDADEIQDQNNDEKRNQDADKHFGFLTLTAEIEKAPLRDLAREPIAGKV
ncbi:hypothetical protein [Nitrobacter sp.]|uniref:hypothetical protein n=1 Tax=unclassified Nitrobacter TaxID=2620411 RepID=UPI003220654D